MSIFIRLWILKWLSCSILMLMSNAPLWSLSRKRRKNWTILVCLLFSFLCLLYSFLFSCEFDVFSPCLCRWPIWQVCDSRLCLLQQASFGNSFYKRKCSGSLWKSNQETGDCLWDVSYYNVISLANCSWEMASQCSSKIVTCLKLFFQVLLFVTSNDSEKFLPVFQEAAKPFKGKVYFHRHN